MYMNSINLKLSSTSIIFSGTVQALEVKHMQECLQYLCYFWKLGYEVSLEIYKYINVSIIENLTIIYFTRIIELR